MATDYALTLVRGVMAGIEAAAPSNPIYAPRFTVLEDLPAEEASGDTVITLMFRHVLLRDEAVELGEAKRYDPGVRHPTLSSLDLPFLVVYPCPVDGALAVRCLALDDLAVLKHHLETETGYRTALPDQLSWSGVRVEPDGVERVHPALIVSRFTVTVDFKRAY